MQPPSEEEMFEQYIDKVFTTMKRGDPLRPRFWKRAQTSSTRHVVIIPAPEWAEGVETNSKFIDDWTQWASEHATAE